MTTLEFFENYHLQKPERQFLLLKTRQHTEKTGETKNNDEREIIEEKSLCEL